MVSKALHKAIYSFKTIFFLKSADLGGLGFNKDQLGNWHVFAIGPAFLILFA